MKTITTDSEKAEINVKLSYMDIKYVLLKFKDYHVDSPETKVCKHLIAGLKAYLVRKAKKGGLPPHIIEDAILHLDEDEKKHKAVEYVDKSTILLKPNKEEENE